MSSSLGSRPKGPGDGESPDGVPKDWTPAATAPQSSGRRIFPSDRRTRFADSAFSRRAIHVGGGANYAGAGVVPRKRFIAAATGAGVSMCT